MTDLPRWVYFPDTERVEWINKLVRQLWPSTQEVVDRTLREATEKGGTMEGYQFEKVTWCFFWFLSIPN